MTSRRASFALFFAFSLFPGGRGAEERGTTLVSPPWTHCLGLHKVTQFHLDIYSGYHEKFNDPEGLYCVKLASKDRLDTRRDDDELTVYGVNSGNSDIIYNKSLTSIGIVGGEGSGPMQFRNPRALTGDAEGNLYVADTGNDRVAHLRYVDDDLVWVRSFSGSPERPLRRPSGISLSGGKLYVADAGNDRIAVFNPDGSFSRSFGAQWRGATLFQPSAVAAVTEGDPWLYYSEYFVIVVDSLGQRLWKLSPDGRAIGLVRRTDLGGAGSFDHVAIDYYGSIYVTDRAAGCIHKFTRYLAYLVAFGSRGTGAGQFDEPRGIACYRRFGQIFVSERSGAQYYWIGTDVLRYSAEDLVFDPARRRCSVKIAFLLTEYSTLSLRLYDDAGKERFTMLSDYILPPGKFDRRIDVDCPDAAALAKCKLSLVATAQPTYSSREYLTVRRASRLLAPRLAGPSPGGNP